MGVSQRLFPGTRVDAPRPTVGRARPHLAGQFLGRLDAPALDEKRRETLRPEVCRTFNFGEKGASKGLFFKTYLESIRVAENRVNWASEDLSYLGYDAYEAAVRESVAAATSGSIRHQVESRLRLHPRRRAGLRRRVLVPRGLQDQGGRRYLSGVEGRRARGAYRGVVTFKMLEGRVTVHFTPSRMVPVAESYRRLHPTP